MVLAWSLQRDQWKRTQGLEIDLSSDHLIYNEGAHEIQQGQESFFNSGAGTTGHADGENERDLYLPHHSRIIHVGLQT